ncbi:polysaccharide pyruvyl transferase family protein [Inmirania thermothiophila]|uniref:Polysaccharide pyruvyl transferase n=1 Tax=Inmirania thermothiophila TaxID=1750597 RepID=A0A3N1XSK2_9GAMM|nr:polysaccharide pyruvyl transferase family protein [Inmirania thermothiophila]ROR29624.1 polysaccharide pyruvyl transferase [Inmirania thermothiophila]
MTVLSVIHAYPAAHNPGMASVDLAAHRLLGRACPGATLRSFVLGDPSPIEETDPGHPLRYLPLQGHLDAVLGSDAILYWGDFLHADTYIERDLAARLIAHGLASSRDEARSLAYRHHLLEGAPRAMKEKVLVFGGTLITNDIRSRGGRRYTEALQELLASARGVWFRDPFSAAYAAPLRPGRQTLGVDPAFLLGSDGWGNWAPPREGPRTGGVALFCGRNRSAWPVHFLARGLARRLREPLTWIHWFPPNRNRYGAFFRLTGFHRGYRPRPVEEILSDLARYRCIVTDTYHLCVNAWRQGVPAICVGRGADRNVGTVSDGKKRALYALYGAMDFYVFEGEIRGPRALRWTAARVAEAAADRDRVGEVHAAMGAHARQARAALLEGLRGLVRSPAAGFGS